MIPMPKPKSKQRHEAPSQPKEPAQILECPPELSPAARQEWDRIVGELISKGVLSAFDRGPLAAYCIAYALAMEAAEMVQKHGAMVKLPNGFPMQSPYLSQLNKQIDVMVRIASEFGFTPASRSRIFSFDQKNSLLLENIEADAGELRNYPQLGILSPSKADQKKSSSAVLEDK
jgi:P27 family predicted phage terminase small subunit